MMRNVELKFRCADLGVIRLRAEALGAEDRGGLSQWDSFFAAPLGRLKLRDFGDGRGELIAYRRPDSTEARGSDYLLANVTDPDALRGVLSFGLGDAGAVRKQRRLFLWRHTRIHLDLVEGLGEFVELETVIVEQSEAAAHEELRWVVDALGLRDEDRIARAYVDLFNDRDSR